MSTTFLSTNSVKTKNTIKKQSKKANKPNKQKNNKKLKSYLKYTFDKFTNGGHKDIVKSLVALSKKGLIASGSYDSTIKVK